MEGVSKFAHLVNVDFFKDLLQVLKGLIERDTTPGDEESTDEIFIHHRLLCIITAFDLLSGQGQDILFNVRESHAKTSFNLIHRRSFEH